MIRFLNSSTGRSYLLIPKIAGRIIIFIGMYLMQNNLEDHVPSADGGYIIQGNVYAPDVAYVWHQRQPMLPQQGFARSDRY